tara:strand:- start:958 stop:1083 length:126 start_codon:yes stop_codon:yes gene_type:complete
MDKEVHQKVRVYCAQKDKGMAEIIEKAVLQYMKKHPVYNGQ